MLLAVGHLADTAIAAGARPTASDDARKRAAIMRDCAHQLFIMQSRCLACEPCRKYYSHHLLGFTDSLCKVKWRTASFVNFTFAMCKFVDAKIHGSNGNGLGKVRGSVMHLRKRLHTLGISFVSSASLIDTLLVQTLQLERLEQGEKVEEDESESIMSKTMWEQGSNPLAVRGAAILWSARLLSTLLWEERPTLARHLKRAIQQAVRHPTPADGSPAAVRKEGRYAPVPSEALFSALLQAKNALEDARGETDGEARARLAPAFSTMLEHWHTVIRPVSGVPGSGAYFGVHGE